MDNLDFFAQWKNNKEHIFSSINKEKNNYLPESLPSLYNIYLVNNYNIPVSFYVFIIEEFFSQKNDNLIKSFNQLRKDGYICYGTFTKDVAESKISNITEVSRISNYSLKCIICKDNKNVIKKS